MDENTQQNTTEQEKDQQITKIDRQADVLDHSSQELLRISKNSRWLDYDRTSQTSTDNQIRLTLI